MTTANTAKSRASKVTPIKADIDVLDPPKNVVTLESGLQVEVVPLKSRQLFKLLRIVTHGLGDSLAALRIDPNDSDTNFGIKLATTLAFAIPEAEEQAFDFIASMVKPVGLIERRGLNDADKERNIELMTQLLDQMDNPEIGDVFTIIEKVVEQETPNLKALGKRLAQMIGAATGK